MRRMPELDTAGDRDGRPARNPTRKGLVWSGERRRVALCHFITGTRDTLLDEPNNHLDAESVHWLEHHLATYKGTVIW
jgi:ATPase subunit of ABC transporter with duplicated ATPase domains